MKKLFFVMILVLSSTAFAQTFPSPIFPRVWNMGNSVQVDIYNHNRVGVSCHGWITMYLESNETQRESVYEHVWPLGTSFRTYRVNNPADKVVRVDHNIRCF